MAWTRAALAVIAVALAAALLVSGGSSTDPRTPPALPGEPPPFLGTAVLGSGGLSAAVDAYGDVVDLRAPGPAGRDLIDNPARRQAAGTVPADTGIVTRVSVGGRPPLALWRADSVAQHYLPRTNVLRTVARFGNGRVVIVATLTRMTLERCVRAVGFGAPVRIETHADLGPGATVRCPGQGAIARAAADDRRWLSRARALGPAAPVWARRMYARSLLTLRALSDSHSGAVVAGARDGWAYVWPRDASAAALAYEAAGYRAQARRTAHFLLGLDLGAAARFDGDGSPVPGRAAEGDARGWVAAAARAAGLPPPSGDADWRGRADYQEKSPGEYLANAIAAKLKPGVLLSLFGGPAGLIRRASEPGSGWDAAAAWAVRPFATPRLRAAARASLDRALAAGGRFGLLPSQDWEGRDPWSAPTAWSAWSLAALGERSQALRLLADLRRAATAAGELPERVDHITGIPTSTTPLAWSHAFVILALLQLWPSRQHVSVWRSLSRREQSSLTTRKLSVPSGGSRRRPGG